MRNSRSWIAVSLLLTYHLGSVLSFQALLLPRFACLSPRDLSALAPPGGRRSCRNSRVRAKNGDDFTEEVFQRLDVRKGERIFLVRDSNYWVQDLQPDARKQRWEKRTRNVAEWIADRLDSLPSRAAEWKRRAVGVNEQTGEASDLRGLGRFGFGLSRNQIEKWISDPRMPTVPELILYGLIGIGTIYAIKLVVFLLDLLIRFSLSLVLIVGVSFFCVLVLYVFASI